MIRTRPLHDITQIHRSVRATVHLRRQPRPQCSKVHRDLSASATTCRELSAHSRHLLFNRCNGAMTRCDAFLMFAYVRYIATTRSACQDFRIDNFLLLRYCSAVYTCSFSVYYRTIMNIRHSLCVWSVFMEYNLCHGK